MACLRLILLALLAACAAPATAPGTAPASPRFQLIELRRASGVIVPPAYAREHWADGRFFGLAIDGFWLVDAKDVNRAYSRVRAELTDARTSLQRLLGARYAQHADLRDLAEILAHFDEYDVQFLGFLVDGKRRVLCNFFTTEVTPQEDLWRHEWIGVAGGGSDFWTIAYDVEADRCLDFSCNASM